MFKTSSTASSGQSNAVYDASGQRVAQQIDGVWQFYIYDVGGKKVAEYGGAQAQDEGGIRYVFTDWQGSTRAITGEAGQVQARMDYTAFGEEINANVGMRTTVQGFNAPNKLDEKYALTERDKATGLDHTWYRKLENQGGRWTSPDPYGGSMNLADPQSFNRYSYVGNDPMNFVDPSGLLMIPWSGYTSSWWVGIDWNALFGVWTVNVSISDSWDNFDVSFGGDFGWLSDGILPQVQDSLPENLKEKVEALAGKCKNLLDSILKALGEKKVESFDFGKLFDRVGGKNISINASKFPKNKDGTENTAMGTSEKEVWSNRRININPAHIPISGREGHIVGVVLQELLHHARSSGLFEDEDLDNAALSLMTSKEQATRKAYMAKKGYKAGSVGHGFVNGNCINKP